MLSFAAPAFLLGLAGLAAPLVIHLINRQRAEPLRFPSIRFIGPSALPQGGRHTPRDWLLLLLRLLFFAMIVLALAQPQWVEKSAATGQSNDSKTVVFMIDASASMSAGDKWDKAKAKVNAVLADLPRDAGIGWVVYADQVMASATPSRGQSVPLSEYTPQPHAGRPVTALGTASAMFDEGDETELIIVSDFQAADWASVTARLPEQVSLRLEPIETEVTNIGLISADVFPAAGKQLTVIVRVKNYSDNAETVLVKLTGADTKSVELQPAAIEPVVFQLENLSARPGIAELSTGSDNYAHDDRYHLWLDAPPPLSVGLLMSDVDEPGKVTEAEFVARALQTGSRSAHRDFQVTFLDEGALAEPEQWPEIIYLAGAGGYLNNSQLEQLKVFVEAGGVLFITPSKTAARQQRALRSAGLTEVAYVGQPGRHNDSDQIFHIGDIAEPSRLATLFDEATSRDLFLADIYQYAKLYPSSNARTLLFEEDGDPILIEETLGQGTVITSAIGFDGSWTDLPLRNAFLPLLRETLTGAVAHEGFVDRRVLAAGDQYNSPQALLVNGQVVQINVDRRESDPASIALSEVRRNLYQFNNTGSPTAIDNNTGTATQPLWPLFALAAAMIYLLETCLAGLAMPRTEVGHA